MIDKKKTALSLWEDSTATPLIQIKGVSKKFGDFSAVDHVTLDIFEGELFCLLGGSGCGKTTLLRMLAGFEEPTTGSIEIDGQNMSGLPPNKRPTNMMFQSYALFPHMSVEKNIAYGLKRDGIANSEIQDRVFEMLKLVQMESFAKRKPHQLSGGQQQRVALSRSLIKKPKLLLLDEPLGALDKKLREETQFEIIKIQETLNITFVVVTHDQEEAMTLSSRIAVMRDGEIVQIGEPYTIYEHPNSRYVADFIGSINIFEARVIEDEENYVKLYSKEAGCNIYVSHGISCVPNQKLWFALRPEKIMISRQAPKSQTNVSKGMISEIAYIGNLSIYRILLDKGKKITVTQSNTSRHLDNNPILANEKVYVSWKKNAGVILQS